MKKQMGTVKWYSLVMAAVCMFTTVIYGQNADIPEVEPSPDPAVENVEVAAESQQVNLSVSEARVQDVLRSLASLRKDVNIVIDPGVTGTVSLQLDGVPWKTALDLITDSQGLVYTKEGPNIYRVSVSAEKVKQGVIVELFTAEEAEALSDEQVMQLVTEEGITVQEARERIASSPQLYVKQLSVDEKSALDVVKNLAGKAGLNYTFSPRAGKPAAPQDGQEGEAAKPAPETPPISLNLRNLSVKRAMVLVADQGGLSAIEEEGVWVISQ
ncbi:MAG: secretin and TonB N-terminal domain-containing protein, partial [Lentisphaeria bacterium]